MKPFAVFALIFFGITSPAFAYVDPNAGGMFFMILTPLLALIATGWVVLRRKLSSFKSSVMASLRKVMTANDRLGE